MPEAKAAPKKFKGSDVVIELEHPATKKEKAYKVKYTADAFSFIDFEGTKVIGGEKYYTDKAKTLGAE